MNIWVKQFVKILPGETGHRRWKTEQGEGKPNKGAVSDKIPQRVVWPEELWSVTYTLDLFCLKAQELGFHIPALISHWPRTAHGVASCQVFMAAGTPSSHSPGAGSAERRVGAGLWKQKMLIHRISLLSKMLEYDQIRKKESCKKYWGCRFGGGGQASSSNRVVRMELVEKMRLEQMGLEELVKQLSGEDGRAQAEECARARPP